jgi:CRP-like cAMP-binding protein
VVAATAIHFVESRALWSLADDLEYALAHRDAKDWYVFEAASWALAARRMAADERRNRWMEPLPAVELADRLRKMSLFDFVSVDELFRVADAGRQVRHENGKLLYEQGGTPDDVEFLLDGRVHEVRTAAGESAARDLDAPAALAFDEVLEGAPATATVKAVDRAICLALRSEQVLALLSENTELAQGLFRMVLERQASSAWQGVVRGVVERPDVVRLGEGLQVIDKILLFEEMPVFARASASDVAALAGISREARLVPGEMLFQGGEAPALFVVITGELALEPIGGGSPLAAGPGDTVGVYETLAGAETTGWRAHVTTPGVALRVDREALFDLLTDRIELLQGLFSALLHGRPTQAQT